MSLWYGTRVLAPSVWSHATAGSARPIAWLRVGALATLVLALRLPAAARATRGCSSLIA